MTHYQNDNNKPMTIVASTLLARFDDLSAEERGAFKKQTPGMIQDYLTGDWYIHRGNLVIDGDFDNDIALVVDGHLTIRGTYNDYQSDTGYLLCRGDFRAQNVMSWNAFAVTGSLYVASFVGAYYNDFPFEVFGEMFQARGLMFSDKAWHLPQRQLVEAGSNNGESEGDLEGIFTPTMLQYYDEDYMEISQTEALELRHKQNPIHVNIVDDWGKALKNIRQGTIFRQSYPFPYAPYKASSDDLRLALMQSQAPEPVFTAAIVRQALWYDLAVAPETSPDLLALLAKNPDWQVREAVAGHAHTPHPLLLNMTKDKDNRVRAALVHNRRVTPDIIDDLINDTAPEVRRAIATSEMARLHLERLLEDEDQSVRRALASHPALSLTQRRKLMADPVLEVRRRALNYTPPTPALVKEFAASDDPEQRAWAARNLNKVSAETQNDEPASKNILKEKEILSLLLNPDHQVRKTAFQERVWMPDLSLETFCRYAERFADDELEVVRFRVAQVCRDGDILARLAQDPREEVRLAVATNLATPASVLVEMVKSLAQLPNTGNGLGASPSQSFVMMLMENPLLPAEAFQYIQRIIPIHYRLEPHGNLPLEIYLAYENYDDPYDPGDQEYEEMEMARRLSEYPAEALSFMARSSRWEFRALAAIHAQTPPDALRHILTVYPQDTYLLENLATNLYLGSGTAEAETIIAALLEQADDALDCALLRNPYLPPKTLLREAHRAPDAAQRVLWQRYGIENENF